jgi:hypothetical protein
VSTFRGEREMSRGAVLADGGGGLFIGAKGVVTGRERQRPTIKGVMAFRALMVMVRGEGGGVRERGGIFRWSIRREDAVQGGDMKRLCDAGWPEKKAVVADRAGLHVN